MKYAIQCLFGYGWDYVGSTDNGERDLYDSSKEAQNEIDTLVASMNYEPDEWRAVPYVPADDIKSDL